MLDGALARLAAALEMEVGDRDTTGHGGDDGEATSRPSVASST